MHFGVRVTNFSNNKVHKDKLSNNDHNKPDNKENIFLQKCLFDFN